jgi:hypothetical protein
VARHLPYIQHNNNNKPSHNKNKTKRLQQNNDKNAEAQLTDSFGEDLPKGSTPTTRPRTTKTALSRTRTGWINDHRQLSDQSNPFAIGSQVGTSRRQWPKGTGGTTKTIRLHQ